MGDRTAELDGYRRLALAVLLQAYRDGHSNNGVATDGRAFLQSEGAAYLVGLLELDPAGLALALEALPRPEWEQLAFELA